MKSVIALTLLAAFVAGCTFFSRAAQNHEPLLQATVKLATVEVLERNPRYAPRVAQIAEQCAASVSGGQLVPLPVLEAQVREQIPWKKLKPAEAVVVDALIITVRMELERATKDLAAPEDVRLLVSQVLGWIAQAARIYSV